MRTNIKSTLHTPYHALGTAEGLRVPGWAERRSVYRTEGRTVYLVETTCLDLARRDLRTLDRAGWEISIDEGVDGVGATIALTQRDLARVA